MSPVVLNSKQISRAISRIAHEIVEKNSGCDNLALVGIRTRGVPFAKRLQAKVKSIENVTLQLGILDITLYRDDIQTGRSHPAIKSTEIPFPVEETKIVLCDDVLFTGRTIRAAIDELMDFGRPAGVQLATLIDRGHRELPIRPDYVGKNIPTNKTQLIKVRLNEEDGEDQVILIDAPQ
jgi:pyrimidine operon attenuation protein / uracil phosphoribosyltransferase